MGTGAGCACVRLLFDEHYSPEIAEQLRRRGHDVLAVSERPELRGLADEVHLATAPDQRRAIVTEIVGDFRPLLANAARAGTANYGLVCVSARRFPRNKKTIGRMVQALDALLRAHPADDGMRDREVWLREA
jgi:nucleoside-diphosphate-sugar epimerase